jgi:hypothetical protein
MLTGWLAWHRPQFLAGAADSRLTMHWDHPAPPSACQALGRGNRVGWPEPVTCPRSPGRDFSGMASGAARIAQDASGRHGQGRLSHDSLAGPAVASILAPLCPVWTLAAGPALLLT